MPPTGPGTQGKAGEGDQQKYPQQGYQFPMTMPPMGTAFPEYYGHDNKQQKHGGGHYDSTGAFFNFSSNEGVSYLLERYNKLLKGL